MNRPEAVFLASGYRWMHWLRRYGGIAAVYVLATGLTTAEFMGDSIDYVASIVAMQQGRDYFFWEFAHLLWRPFGWVVCAVFTPLTSSVVGANPSANVTYQLLAISWLSGLLAVVLTHGLLRRLVKREWIANMVAVALVFSYGFLNHAQSGAPYVPGLALLVLGLYILLGDEDQPERSRWRGVLAGAALAGSVSLWITYVLAVPAALTSPLFVFGLGKKQLRLVVVATLSWVVLIGLAYAAVLAHLGIHGLTDLTAWMAASADAATVPRGGVPRMVFSLARSFLNMGDDGILFKRFLRQDPINPVTLSELLLLSVAKLGLFYLFLSAIVAKLLRVPDGRRLLGLAVLSAIPVMALALFLEGGAVDRYLPLYPFLFLALGGAVSRSRLMSPPTLVALTFVAAAVIINSSALANVVVHGQQEKAAARIRDLRPLLKRESLVVTVNIRDELVNFNRSFPLDPINLDGDRPLRVGSIIVPGSAQVSWWRQGFASGVLKTWKGQGDVWISKRVLSARPRSEWGWVESDDPRVSWGDVHAFFSTLELGRSLGGEDGFVLLASSARNQELFRRLAEENR